MAKIDNKLWIIIIILVIAIMVWKPKVNESLMAVTSVDDGTGNVLQLVSYEIGNSKVSGTDSEVLVFKPHLTFKDASNVDLPINKLKFTFKGDLGSETKEISQELDGPFTGDISPTFNLVLPVDFVYVPSSVQSLAAGTYSFDLVATKLDAGTVSIPNTAVTEGLDVYDPTPCVPEYTETETECVGNVNTYTKIDSCTGNKMVEDTNHCCTNQTECDGPWGKCTVLQTFKATGEPWTKQFRNCTTVCGVEIKENKECNCNSTITWGNWSKCDNSLQTRTGINECSQTLSEQQSCKMPIFTMKNILVALAAIGIIGFIIFRKKKGG